MEAKKQGGIKLEPLKTDLIRLASAEGTKSAFNQGVIDLTDVTSLFQKFVPVGTKKMEPALIKAKASFGWSGKKSETAPTAEVFIAKLFGLPIKTSNRPARQDQKVVSRPRGSSGETEGVSLQRNSGKQPKGIVVNLTGGDTATVDSATMKTITEASKNKTVADKNAMLLSLMKQLSSGQKNREGIENQIKTALGIK